MIAVPVSVQKTLAGRGLYTGKPDGAMGPLTLRALMAVAAGFKSPLDVDWELAKALWVACLDAGWDSRLRIIHPLAQCCAETARWQFMVEQGGESYFRQYDGRYGNTAPGDGYRFRGRGFPMLTFKSNFAAASDAIGRDLVANPDLAADPTVSAEVLAWYWASRKINASADADDLGAVTRKLNGGLNGLEMRLTALNRLKAVWPPSA